MRLGTREIVLGAVIAVLLAVLWARPDFTAIGRSKDFPDDVAVKARKPVNIYGDQLNLRTLQLLDSINAMWADAFEAVGDKYERPLIDTEEGHPSEGCGSDSSGWTGIYCSREHSIVIDLANAKETYELLGESAADDRVAYVLAHEVGHHVQAQRGQLGANTQEGAVKSELQAQCMAGLYAHATGRPLPPAWTYADDGGHGTVAEQRTWLERGWRTGRPAVCERIWD